MTSELREHSHQVERHEKLLELIATKPLPGLSQDHRQRVAEAFSHLRREPLPSSALIVSHTEYTRHWAQRTYTLRRNQTITTKIIPALQSDDFWTKMRAAAEVPPLLQETHECAYWRHQHQFWLMSSAHLASIAEQKLPTLDTFIAHCLKTIQQKEHGGSSTLGENYLLAREYEHVLSELADELASLRRNLAEEMVWRLRVSDLNQKPLFDDPLWQLSRMIRTLSLDHFSHLFSAFHQDVGAPRESLDAVSMSTFIRFIGQHGSQETQEIFATLSWQEKNCASRFFYLTNDSGIFLPRQENQLMMTAQIATKAFSDRHDVLRLFYAYQQLFFSTETFCSHPDDWELMDRFVSHMQDALILINHLLIHKKERPHEQRLWIEELLMPLQQRILLLFPNVQKRMIKLLTVQQNPSKYKPLLIQYRTFTQHVNPDNRSVIAQALEPILHQAELDLFHQPLSQKETHELVILINQPPETSYRELFHPENEKAKLMLKQPDILKLKQRIEQAEPFLSPDVASAFQLICRTLQKQPCSQEEFLMALQSIVKESGDQTSLIRFFKNLLDKWLWPQLNAHDVTLITFIQSFDQTVMEKGWSKQSETTFQWVSSYLKLQQVSTISWEAFIQEITLMKRQLIFFPEKSRELASLIDKYMKKRDPDKLTPAELIIDQLGTKEQLQTYGRRRFRFFLRHHYQQVLKDPFFLYHYNLGTLNQEIHKEISDFSIDHLLEITPQLLETFVRDPQARDALALQMDSQWLKHVIKATQDSQKTTQLKQLIAQIKKNGLTFPMTDDGLKELDKLYDRMLYGSWSPSGHVTMLHFCHNGKKLEAYIKKYFTHFFSVEQVDWSFIDELASLDLIGQACVEPCLKALDSIKIQLQRGIWSPHEQTLKRIERLLNSSNISPSTVFCLLKPYTETFQLLKLTRINSTNHVNTLNALIEKKDYPQVCILLDDALQSIKLSALFPNSDSLKKECDHFREFILHLMSLTGQNEKLPDELDQWTKKQTKYPNPPKILKDLFVELAFLTIENNWLPYFTLFDKWGLDHQAKWTQFQLSFYHLAAFHGHHHFFNLLASWSDLSPSCLSSDGSTPLHSACRNRQPTTTEWLIQHHCPLEQISDYERTALMQAVVSSSSQCVEKLINAGAQVKRHEKCMDGPIHCAVLNLQQQENIEENFAIIKELLTADRKLVNEQNSEGQTLLHLTLGRDILSRLSKQVLKQLYQLLLGNGASETVKDKQGLTPLQLAEKRSLSEQIDLFKEAQQELHFPPPSHPTGAHLFLSGKNKQQILKKDKKK